MHAPQLAWTNDMDILEHTEKIVAKLSELPVADRVELLNEIRLALHEVSPFKSEPVDCVLWISSKRVEANDYNPNSVAPPEMELLRLSIAEDGYTQPIVGFDRGDGVEVIDGFHRNRVGRECEDIQSRIHGYLPLALINSDREGREDRIASTIRHNRARGKHQVEAMSDIVVELKRRNWSNKKIAKQLGMEQDEILRLCQITGLSDLFLDEDFSRAWDVEGSISPEDFEELDDDIEAYGDDIKKTRTVNTSDEGRVFHTYDKWECHKAGFYATTKEGMSKTQCKQAACDFLCDLEGFADVLAKVIVEWPNSCEHYLTNIAMNRIAWLGQASICYATGISTDLSRGGFSLMTTDQQDAANAVALKYLNQWAKANGRPSLTADDASPERESEIY